VACELCALTFRRRAGVWDFLPPERAVVYQPFLEQYTAVRLGEGRGDWTPDDLRGLPWVGPDHPRAWEWYIRATSFECLMDHVVPAAGEPGLVRAPIAGDPGRPRGKAAGGAGGGGGVRGPGALRVLDLGAGTGWMCYRLSLEGHAPLAVDLSVDARDGLGAARCFAAVLDRPFPRLRAEFDRLPLADGAADLVIFNASFHYSADYTRTLGEAMRVMAPAGRVVIMDTPIYRDDASGERMVASRRAAFQARFGFPSNTLGSREYLTDTEITRLGERLGLRWRVLTPPYGWTWMARRWWRRLRHGRESARFALVVGWRQA